VLRGCRSPHRCLDPSGQPAEELRLSVAGAQRDGPAPPTPCSSCRLGNGGATERFSARYRNPARAKYEKPRLDLAWWLISALSGPNPSAAEICSTFLASLRMALLLIHRQSSFHRAGPVGCSVLGAGACPATWLTLDSGRFARLRALTLRQLFATARGHDPTLQQVGVSRSC